MNNTRGKPGGDGDVLAVFLSPVMSAKIEEYAQDTTMELKKDSEPGSWLCKLTHKGQSVTVPVHTIPNEDEWGKEPSVRIAISALWFCGAVSRYYTDFQAFVKLVYVVPQDTPATRQHWQRTITAGNRGRAVYGNPLGMNYTDLSAWARGKRVITSNERR